MKVVEERRRVIGVFCKATCDNEGRIEEKLEMFRPRISPERHVLYELLLLL